MKTHQFLTKNIILITLVAAMLSCENATESGPSYLLRTVVEPNDAGTITPSQGAYEEGENIQLTATPHQHWKFVRWEGDLTGTGNPAGITMDGDKEVSALFVKREYPLNLTIQGEGAVTESIMEQKVTDYPYQTVVELTADPSEGWKFSHWEGAVTGTENPVQVIVESEVEITAVFLRQYYSLVITTEGEGSVSVELVSGNRMGDEFEYESVISILAQPQTGWDFLGWQGDLDGATNPIEIVVDGDIAATAVMGEVPFVGEGTLSNPYQIATLEQLNAIRDRFLNDHFLQVADIDASETAGWNNGEGFIPIGLYSGSEFTGSFDGNGFRIEGLTINLNPVYYFDFISIGLFGRIKGGLIRDLKLENSEITGFDNALGTGVLAGLLSAGSRIENVHISGLVKGMNYVGGVVGILEQSEIYTSFAEVTVEGNSDVGGLVGASNDGKVIGSRASGTVTGNQNIGGLIGAQREGKTVRGSSADVTVTGNKNVGGLIGASTNTKETVVYCYASGNVTGSENTGGLIGFFSGYASVGESYAIGNVSSNEGVSVGGLIGVLALDSQLYKSYALGTVTGKSVVGGLVGRNSGLIVESYAAGLVSASQQYGGLAGDNQGVLNNSYWDIEATGQADPVWDLYRGTTDATGLATSQMTGSNARMNMPDFDWGTTWNTSPTYPVLQALPPSPGKML